MAVDIQNYMTAGSDCSLRIFWSFQAVRGIYEFGGTFVRVRGDASTQLQ